MKILTVSHYFESNGAGVEIIAAKIREELRKRGITVRWIAAQAKNCVTNSFPSDGDCVAIPMWDGIRKWTDLAWPLPSPLSLRKFWREVRQTDVVHLHEPFYPACQIVYWLAKILRKPVVITQHIADMPTDGKLRKAAVALANALLTRPAHRGAKRVVYYSDRTQRFFHISIGNRGTLIHNGCDSAIFRCLERTAVQEAREQLSLPGDQSIALFVGRFIEKKGLRILQNVAVGHPEICFVFVGLGPLDPVFWKLLNVRVFPPLSHAELSLFYRAADILLLPAVGEGFPLVVQEAMCSGVPCLLSVDVADGCPAFLDDYVLAGSAGIDTERTLLNYLNHPMSWDSRKDMACRAQELWSWDRCTQEYASVFKEVLSHAN